LVGGLAVQRFRLRDDQWDRIKGILPGREETVGVTAADNRLFDEAVLYRTGGTRSNSLNRTGPAT
jgi:hypothetical protein